MIVVTIESPLGHVAPEMTTLEMIYPLLLQLKFMSFLGDPRNMAEIDKDQLKNFDISYIFPDADVYSGHFHLENVETYMERLTEQVTAIGGIVPAQTSQFIEQLWLDADSMMNTGTAAPSPVTTTAPESWCPYSTHDGCGCPPGKAWNYKGLFRIP